VNALLFRTARWRILSRLSAWAITKMNFLIPAERLYETGALLAFHHPNPSYPLHILIMPKRSIRSLMEIGAEDQDFSRDLFACTKSLVNRFLLEEQGYRLIANGGKNQDIPLLHFHLVSETWKPEGS